jgi:predicted permease
MALNKVYPALPAEVRSRIVTLWGVLLVAVLVVGSIALYLGTFIRGNVRDQLAAQQIVFPTVAELTPQEKAEAACLTQYAGVTMTTGAQAQCYSEHYIALHMKESANRAGFPGATYATLGKEQTKLRAEIAEAQKAGNEQAVKAANDRLAAATGLRTSMQTGSTLRGQLLNAWGWDTFGIGVIVSGVALFAVALVFAVALGYELTTRPAGEVRKVPAKAISLVAAAQ